MTRPRDVIRKMQKRITELEGENGRLREVVDACMKPVYWASDGECFCGSCGIKDYVCYKCHAIKAVNLYESLSSLEVTENEEGD